MAKNNLLKRFATSARAEVAQLALCASNCGMPTSGFCRDDLEKFARHACDVPLIRKFYLTNDASSVVLRFLFAFILLNLLN